jgi:hypothetical protein
VEDDMLKRTKEEGAPHVEDGRKYIALALVVFGVHTLAVMFLPSSAFASNVLVDCSAAVASFACYRRARLLLDSARWKWALIALALFFWCYAQALLTYDEAYRPRQPQSAALSPTLYYFLFGISLLLVVSLIGQRRKIPAVVWLDALQGLIGIYLVHLQVFSSTTGARLSPAISEMRLSYAYNAGTFTLALGATLRVMAKPRGEEARLYRVLCIFMWVYALLSAGLGSALGVSLCPADHSGGASAPKPSGARERTRANLGRAHRYQCQPRLLHHGTAHRGRLCGTGTL